MDLKQIESFVRVAELGSFSRAAVALGIAQPLLSRHVRQLEVEYRQTFLLRNGRGVTLTDRGQAFSQRALRIIDDLNLAADEVAEQGHELVGQLRIAAPLSFGSRYLGELLFPFLAHHPRLQVALDLEDRTVDLVREGYDLGIRVTRNPALELKARRLALSRRVVVCSPAYRQREGDPVDYEELLRHPAIGYANVSASQLWQFEPPLTGGEVKALPMRGRIVVNNGESAMSAAKAGLGVAMLPLFIVAEALCKGELVCIAGFASPVPDHIYAVYPQTRYVSRAVRGVIDYLVTSLSETPPWERGLPCGVRPEETP